MAPFYDTQKILDILPHRYPFILVDRILACEPGKRIRGLKNVTINEPFFTGHFPDMPIMPGVLIVEAMAQTGGVLVLASIPDEQREKGVLVYFMGMDRVRFRKPVTPGDQLIFDVDMMNLRSRAAKIAATASVDGQVVAEAELLASFGVKE